MRPDSITLAIFEKYTPEELAETAQKLVQALADKETAETEKKTSDAVFKERINKHETEAATLAKQYAKGGETAQIGCDIRYDHPKPGKKSYFRMDRNELVETHDMSWEEKQETIQFPLTESPAPEPTVSDLSAASLEKLTAPSQEEVTRICEYPGCILFADHDGMHEFPLSEDRDADAALRDQDAIPPTSEPAKRKRKSKPPHVPPDQCQRDEPPSSEAGAN